MIKFDQVSKKFNTGETILKDVSFEIKPKEIVVIKGPSGSGKTTLLNLIYKQTDPSSGSILVDGLDTKKITSKELPKYRRQIGFAFQDFKIIPDLTVWENIALALEIMDLDDAAIAERVTHLLDLVKLPKKSNLFPVQLSGGELQRVSIARAIATEPQILLADEPTGNLDLDTSLQIADLLKQINKLGTTVILATHDHDVSKHLKGREIELKNNKIDRDSSKKSKNKS